MDKGQVGDMRKLGVKEAYILKRQILISGTEAAEMILHVDETIKKAPLIRIVWIHKFKHIYKEYSIFPIANEIMSTHVSSDKYKCCQVTMHRLSYTETDLVPQGTRPRITGNLADSQHSCVHHPLMISNECNIQIFDPNGEMNSDDIVKYLLNINDKLQSSPNILRAVCAVHNQVVKVADIRLMDTV
ncbi:hypothetical protein GJ496_003480 [Pomphorhynchus laevis]|nr:hypothetical protein GJ496_003480 [Pomphorhynchus laevis]